MTLPRIKINHLSQEELNKLSLRQRLASYMGVPKELLDYTEDSYLEEDSFRIYDYRLTSFEDNVGEKFKNPPVDQYKRAHQLIHSDMKNRFIVINSFPFLFTTPREGHRQDFFMHVLGCLANRMSRRELSINLDLAFLGTATVDYSQPIELRNEQILVWGPVHDRNTNSKIQETISFLYNFRSTTKILLTSVEKLSLLLLKLGVDPRYPTDIFDVRTSHEKLKNPSGGKSKGGKPPKASRVAAVPRELSI